MKTVEFNAVLRVMFTNPGERNVDYKAVVILKKRDKFKLQQDLLTTELEHVAIKEEGK